MWPFLNRLTSLGHNFLIWTIEMVPYYSPPSGLLWRLNKIMANWKGVSFHHYYYRLENYVSRELSDLPKVTWIPSGEWSVREGFKIMGVCTQSQWLIFSSQLLISLKLTESAIFPFLALTFGNVHCLLLRRDLDSRACVHVTWAESEQSPAKGPIVNVNTLNLYMILKFNMGNTLTGFKTQEAQKVFTEKSLPPLIYPLPSSSQQTGNHFISALNIHP